MRTIFLTLFYSGLTPKASGTVGSFVAFIIGMLFLNILNISNIFMIAILIAIIAIKQIDIYEKETNIHDSKKIVIDEFVGMWFALSIAQIDANMWSMGFLTFIYFRIFDIWKPSIIGKIDKNIKNGFGVVADDILAGIFAGICTNATKYLFVSFHLG
jgi:phosphatidylglycerophosphatase A